MTKSRACQSGLVVAIGLCALVFSSGPGLAQNATLPDDAGAPLPAAGQIAAPKAAKRHFIEFRSRMAQSYGHAYVIFGTVNARGKIIKGEIAGIHPASDSVVPWMIGHLVPVPSETGASDGDSEDQYTTARYRIMLSEPEYKKVAAYIKHLKATSPSWHAVLYNCVSFVKDIATFMKLKTPMSNIAYPEVFINNLREMNTNAEGMMLTQIPHYQWGMAPSADAAGASAPKPSAARSGSRSSASNASGSKSSARAASAPAAAPTAAATSSAAAGASTLH